MTLADHLTDLERDILELERSWFKSAGVKQSVVRERFGMSATRYSQALGALLDRPAALAHDPQLVNRLRRLRIERRRLRTAAVDAVHICT